MAKPKRIPRKRIKKHDSSCMVQPGNGYQVCTCKPKAKRIPRKPLSGPDPMGVKETIQRAIDAKPKTNKRILSVTIKRMMDDSPDTSWLGEYSNKEESTYSIDRAHSEDCASQGQNASKAQTILEHARGQVWAFQEKEEHESPEWEALEEAYHLLDDLIEEVAECDCGERGDMQRNEFAVDYRYFNPVYENYKGETEEDIRKYCRQDYERMESLNRGSWCFIGIRAEAEIGIGDLTNYPAKFNCTTQTITSGGLWGIESDSDKSYFEETEAEELSQLKDQLKALGFGTRAISTAFKNVQHKGE